MKPGIGFLLVLCLGSSTFAQPPLQTLLEVDYFGKGYGMGGGMIGLGDINHDGKPDIAVSAWNINKTFIYFGGKGVFDDTVDFVIKGKGGIQKGDLNGDGVTDLAILTYKDTSWINYIGIYFGKKDAPIQFDTIPDVYIRQESSQSNFGSSFAIGDLNNDGYDDLVVGAQNYDHSRGKVNIYFGGPNFTGHVDEWASGDTIQYLYGSKILIADINGDGVKDLAIGSDRRPPDNGNIYDGLLDIYYGKTGWHFTKNGYDERFDRANTGGLYPNQFGLVDVNADGKADISMVRGDSAYFFYGRTDSVRHTADFILQNPDTVFYPAFGGPASPIGDINNDGKPDYAILMAGGGRCLAAYLGNTVPETNPVGDRCRSGVSGGFDPIVGLGDLNGDGAGDFGTVMPFDLYSPSDGWFIVFKGSSYYVSSVEASPHVGQAPGVLSLSQNYPNPFNPSTKIDYTLEKDQSVTLAVYDLAGRIVKTLLEGAQSRGAHTIDWDGLNEDHRAVSSGTYFFTIKTGNDQKLLTKKMIVIR